MAAKESKIMFRLSRGTHEKIHQLAVNMGISNSELLRRTVEDALINVGHKKVDGFWLEAPVYDFLEEIAVQEDRPIQSIINQVIEDFHRRSVQEPEGS